MHDTTRPLFLHGPCRQKKAQVNRYQEQGKIISALQQQKKADKRAWQQAHNRANGNHTLCRRRCAISYIEKNTSPDRRQARRRAEGLKRASMKFTIAASIRRSPAPHPLSVASSANSARLTNGPGKQNHNFLIERKLLSLCPHDLHTGQPQLQRLRRFAIPKQAKQMPYFVQQSRADGNDRRPSLCHKET